MEIKELHTFHNTRPFQPFIIHLVDGQKIPVNHSQFLAIASTENIIVVVVFQIYGSFNIIDSSLVTNLEVKVKTS